METTQDINDDYWDDKAYIKPNDEQWQFVNERNVRIGRKFEDAIEEASNRLGISFIRNKINGKGADFRRLTNTTKRALIEGKDTFPEFIISKTDAIAKYDSRFLRFDPTGVMLHILIVPQYNPTPMAKAILSPTHIIETHLQITDESTKEEIELVTQTITKKLSQVLLLSSCCSENCENSSFCSGDAAYDEWCEYQSKSLVDYSVALKHEFDYEFLYSS